MLWAPGLPWARVPFSCEGLAGTQPTTPVAVWGVHHLQKNGGPLFPLFMKEALVGRLGAGARVLRPCPEGSGFSCFTQ